MGLRRANETTCLYDVAKRGDERPKARFIRVKREVADEELPSGDIRIHNSQDLLIHGLVPCTPGRKRKFGE